MQQEDLERWWQLRRGRKLRPSEFSQIQAWVDRAVRQFQAYGSLEDALEQHKLVLELSQAPHILAGVRFRARLDLHQRRLTLYARALEELAPHCPDPKLRIQTMLAHEIFHLLCPECPGPFQEASAHGFAARVCGLQSFPGNWDLEAE